MSRVQNDNFRRTLVTIRHKPAPKPIAFQARWWYHDAVQGGGNADGTSHNGEMPKVSARVGAKGQGCKAVPGVLQEIVRDKRRVNMALGDTVTMMTIAPPTDWHEVKGISAGVCVADGKKFSRRAHAHSVRADTHFGWICVLADPTGSLSKTRYGILAPMSGRDEAQVIKPSRLLWHEYAHILTPGHWHDDAWRRKMKELGQPLGVRYNEQRRRWYRSR